MPVLRLWLLIAIVGLHVAFAWDSIGAWKLCINAVCQSRPLDVSTDPDRCSEFDRKKFGLSPGALCLSQGDCKRKCGQRGECHHVQAYVNEEVCYLKPMTCEEAGQWFADAEYFAFVKSGLPVGCPEQPPKLSATEPRTTTTTADLSNAPELIVYHTPSPLDLPPASHAGVPITLSFHTPAPVVAPPPRLPKPAEAVPSAAPAWTAAKDEQESSQASPARARQHPTWPHGLPPEESLTNPGDRWYVRLGKRCIHEGLGMGSSDDQCLKHPKRNGFVGSFRFGRAAICLDVNHCMQLCDKTEDCFAVEMSQDVDRCQLKPAGCLLHEQWEPDASSNLVVLSRSRRTTTSTTTALFFSDEPLIAGSEVLLRAARIIANSSALKVQREEMQKSNQNLVEESRLEHLVSLMHFSLFDLPDGSRQSFKYSGSMLRGCTLYLVPFNEGNVGIFDTAARQFRTVALPAMEKREWKYSAGVMREDGIAYFVPYAADHIGVFDTRNEEFRTIDVSSATSADCKYSSAIFSDGGIYFIPSSENNIGVFLPSTEDFHTIPLPHPSDTSWKYRGGVAVDGIGYFAPYNADDVGILDIEALTFRSLDISSAISTDTKFSDAFEQNGVVYFVPFNADAVGALNIETEHFELLDISKSISRDFKYWGAVADAGLTYFVPDNADSIGVLHASSQSFATIDISSQISTDFKFSSGILVNGAIYFLPRNADSIGILQVDRSDPSACPKSVSGFGASGPKQALRAGAHHVAPAAPKRSSEARGESRPGQPPSELGELLQSAAPAVSAVSSERFLACAVLTGSVIFALLSRQARSRKLGALQSLMSSVLAVLVSALFFFVLRGGLELLRQRPTAFGVQILPAMGFFIGLYGLLQAALLQDRSKEATLSLDLERPLPEALMVCLGYVALFAAVDAGGALQHFFGGSAMQVALSLPVFQLLLLALDRLASSLSPGPRRLGALLAEALCSGPIALLSVEVLSYAILGNLSLEKLMNRRGQLQDGVSLEMPATSDGLALLAVAALFPAALAWEELPLTLRRACATASAWAALRGSRWIAKSWGWLPRVESFRPELAFALVASAAGLGLGWLLERRIHETRSPKLSSTASLANGALGLSLGLLWAARLQRAAAAVAPAPWALLVCFLLALILLGLLARPCRESALPDLLLRDPGYAPTGSDSPTQSPTSAPPDALRQAVRLYSAMPAGAALCPPSVLAARGRGSYPDPYDPGDLAQPGPRLCLEEPGPTLIIPLD